MSNGQNILFWEIEVWEQWFPIISRSRKTMWVREKLSHSKPPSSANLIIFWYKWEARSQMVSMKAFNFSPKPWNFWSIKSLENLVWRLQSQRGETLDFQTPSMTTAARRANSEIQIQAPANAPRDEILPQGKPSLLTKRIQCPTSMGKIQS